MVSLPVVIQINIIAAYLIHPAAHSAQALGGIARGKIRIGYGKHSVYAIIKGNKAWFGKAEQGGVIFRVGDLIQKLEKGSPDFTSAKAAGVQHIYKGDGNYRDFTIKSINIHPFPDLDSGAVLLQVAYYPFQISIRLLPMHGKILTEGKHLFAGDARPGKRGKEKPYQLFRVGAVEEKRVLQKHLKAVVKALQNLLPVYQRSLSGIGNGLFVIFGKRVEVIYAYKDYRR